MKISCCKKYQTEITLAATVISAAAALIAVSKTVDRETLELRAKLFALSSNLEMAAHKVFESLIEVSNFCLIKLMERGNPW